MPQSDAVNRQIVLAAHPDGAPKPADFRLEEGAVPSPAEGQLLVRTMYLSLDPYMRNTLDEIAPVYIRPSKLGEPVIGQAVGAVVASRSASYRVGDRVLAFAGWQDYAVVNADDVFPLGQMAQPSQALGVLGMPSFTAYVGLLDIGRPQAGETVVVAAATGAVGSVVGQLAKIKGARVVGIAGGTDKCQYAVKELGFDVCLDRRDPQLAVQLAAACPGGIDVYFENVGGVVFEAVLPLLNVRARMPVCGIIAHYNDKTPPPGPNRLPQFMGSVLQKRILVQGFIISDHYATRLESFHREMGSWVENGAVKLREDIVDGLENAPAAFIGLLEGRNFGKLVVRVAAQ